VSPAIPAKKLEALLEAGRAAWPGLDVEAAAFSQLLSKKLPEGADLSTLHTNDLYLACACLSGSAKALAAFERAVLPKISEAISRIDPSPAFSDEVRQLVRQRLLMAQGNNEPKISDYGGQGSLVGWVRAVALRLALNSRRGGKNEVLVDDEVLLDLPSQDQNLELAYIKAKYREQFKAAFVTALASLTTEQRAVLRMNFIDGLNIEQIGELQGTHRSTIARWIAQARKDLLARTRKELVSRLKLTREELESLMGMVQSNLELSISRFLKD
jgi:RNA polymerase sigma-70 factor, ECF subfamily